MSAHISIPGEEQAEGHKPPLQLLPSSVNSTDLHSCSWVFRQSIYQTARPGLQAVHDDDKIPFEKIKTAQTFCEIKKYLVVSKLVLSPMCLILGFGFSL